MEVKQKIKERVIKLIFVAAFVLTGIGYVKGIFISLDIDESYALAQSYRMAAGERLFSDMWEPHQLSAFLGALFIKIYLLFGTTDYLVIYMRIIGMLIHGGMGIWLYHTIKSEFRSNVSLLILLLHLNFFPKWLQIPEFELMHYWFLLSVFLLLLPYYRGSRNAGRLLSAGVCLVGAIMCYPTMIFLYPFYLIGIYLAEKNSCDYTRRKCLQSFLWFTAGALLTGILFILYLLSYQTPEMLIHNIEYLLMDESHTAYTMSEKWLMYANQAGEMAEIYVDQLWRAALLVLFAGILFVIGMKLRKKTWHPGNAGKVLEWLTICVLVMTAVLLEKEHIIGCLLEDENQFYGQIRYVAAVLPGILLGIRYAGKMGDYFWFGIIPAIVSVPLTLLITNMNVNVMCSKVVPGIWISILLLVFYIREERKKLNPLMKYAEFLPGILAGSVLLGFLVCRLVLIRVTGCLPVTMMAPLERMNYGPEKGVYILSSQAQIWNENYRILEEIIDEEDHLLYIGAETLIYPAMECELSTPSTQGTTVFNEQFLAYLEEHPDKSPSVVVIDKTFATNPVYTLFSDAGIVLDWVEKEYPNAQILETPYMKILFCGTDN